MSNDYWKQRSEEIDRDIERFWNFLERLRDLIKCRHHWKVIRTVEVYGSRPTGERSKLPFRRDATLQCKKCGKLRKQEDI